MTLVAAIDPNAPQWVGAIALVLFAIAGGCNQVAALIDRWRGKPANEQLAQSHDSLGHRVGQLEQVREADAKEASAQRRRLYESVEELRTEVTEMVGDVDQKLTRHVEDVRKELSADIKDVAKQVGETPAETVALLRNTGVIK